MYVSNLSYSKNSTNILKFAYIRKLDVYLQDTQRTFENYIEIAESVDGRNPATEGIPGNVR